MSSIAVIELTWSEVFKGKFKDTYSAFVLLFLAMKNRDIVSCKINLPLKGIYDCFILPKQSPNPKVIIASLAWVTPLKQENSGVLAAGYADGCVYLLSVNHDPTLTRIHGLQMTYIAVQAITDFMPVSCLPWVTRDQLNPVLIYTKQQFIFAHPLDVTGTSEQNGADKEQQTVGIRSCCTHAQLGNSLPATSLHCVGSTILMSAEDGTVRLLAIQGTSSDCEIKLVKQLHFDLEEPEWECISAAVSPNGLISIALFSPSFMFDNLHERFRNPTYFHMCCIPTVDMETLETLLSSHTEADTDPEDIQLELLDPQTDHDLKEKFKSDGLLDFYGSLSEESFPNLKNFAAKLLSLFGSTYICEQAFSCLKINKSKNRSLLSDCNLHVSCEFQQVNLLQISRILLKFASSYIHLIRNQ